MATNEVKNVTSAPLLINNDTTTVNRQDSTNTINPFSGEQALTYSRPLKNEKPVDIKVFSDPKDDYNGKPLSNKSQGGLPTLGLFNNKNLLSQQTEQFNFGKISPLARDKVEIDNPIKTQQGLRINFGKLLTSLRPGPTPIGELNQADTMLAIKTAYDTNPQFRNIVDMIEANSRAEGIS